jgi:hypothetical protein
MIRDLLHQMDLEASYSPDALVYIDTDASERFWDYVGLVPNPNLDNHDTPEYGYEKQIRMDDLLRFSK